VTQEFAPVGLRKPVPLRTGNCVVGTSALDPVTHSIQTSGELPKLSPWREMTSPGFADLDQLNIVGCVFARRAGTPRISAARNVKQERYFCTLWRGCKRLAGDRNDGKSGG